MCTSQILEPPDQKAIILKGKGGPKEIIQGPVFHHRYIDTSSKYAKLEFVICVMGKISKHISCIIFCIKMLYVDAIRARTTF